MIVAEARDEENAMDAAERLLIGTGRRASGTTACRHVAHVAHVARVARIARGAAARIANRRSQLLGFKGFFLVDLDSPLAPAAKLDSLGRQVGPSLRAVPDVAVRDHLGMICAANRMGAPVERTR